MALTECPDCGGKVSTEAPSCPHCGRPTEFSSPKPSRAARKAVAPKKRSSRTGCLILVLLFLLAALLLPDKEPGTTKPSKPKPQPGTSTKPKPQKPTTVDLGATVSFSGTQFTIVNRDSFAWTDCKLEINAGIFSGGYNLNAARLSAGQSYTVGAMQFAKSDGERFNLFSHKAKSFTMSCDTPKGRGWYFGNWQ